MDSLLDVLRSTGFAQLHWQMVVMWTIVAVLLYLAVVKQFEPLLLVPISLGALLANLPIQDVILHAPVIAPDGEIITPGGLFYYIQKGVKLEIFPPLIFMGVGALTDFGPLIANPRTLLLGAAAQFGIFATFFAAVGSGVFSLQEAAAIGIIGGADGPTSIFVANKLAPHLLGAIAVAAYSYMALVPVIQPPVMRLLTSESERKIRMQSLRKVSKVEKMVFAILVMAFCLLVVPDAAPLISMLFIGNFLRENGMTERLLKAAQNEIINVVTIFLGLTVGLKMGYDKFLDPKTLGILALGVVAFIVATASGVIMAKLMNLFSKNKINPLIGSAGVSAVPMAARVSQVEGQKADPGNFLLMHAMGPNVAGVIGSALAAGYFIATLGG
ncbi:MAG: sodium ion-translocating decarboxylase subunit beta [Opitutales bacterium]|jgi:sodium ion-translocating decarboxylase beta subunit